jgi:hypothetical protein
MVEKDAEIQIRLKILDKWKILIQNPSDRKDFESDLASISIYAYKYGYRSGREVEIAEQQKREAGRILPLEKTND